jgi:AcrR family transcriptional regulator
MEIFLFLILVIVAQRARLTQSLHRFDWHVQHIRRQFEYNLIRILVQFDAIFTIFRRQFGRRKHCGCHRTPIDVKGFHMGWSGHGGRGRRGYHHGDLREALIAAALELIGQHGPFGFTFVDAARWVGVSPAAPYRHFRDRNELMAEVARRGFEKFEAALAHAWNEGRPDPMTAFEALGRAYLAFAKAEHAYYSSMFEAAIPLGAYPELLRAGERAFAVLRQASEALCAKLPKESRPPALMMGLHVWAMSHGIASLFGRGDAARRALPMSPEDLLEAGVLVYLRGLGLVSDVSPPASP